VVKAHSILLVNKLFLLMILKQ